MAVCSRRGAPVPAAPTRHTQHSSTPTSTRGPATNLQPRHSTRPFGVTLRTDSNAVSGRHSYSLQLRPLLHPQHSRRQQASPSVTPWDLPRPLGHIRDLPRPLGHTSGCPTTPRSHQGPPASPQSHLGTSRDPSVTSGTSRVPSVTPRDVPCPVSHIGDVPRPLLSHRGCPTSPVFPEAPAEEAAVQCLVTLRGAVTVPRGGGAVMSRLYQFRGSLGTLGDELCDHHGANTILRGCIQTWLSPERRAGDGRRPEGRERRSRPP